MDAASSSQSLSTLPHALHGENCVVADNLGDLDESAHIASETFLHPEHMCLVTVVCGTLQVVSADTLIQVCENQTLVIMPHTSVFVHESQCRWHAILIHSIRIADVLAHMVPPPHTHPQAYTCRHLRLKIGESDNLTHSYLRIKQELALPPYSMQPVAIRACVAAYMAKWISLVVPGGEISHINNKRLINIFHQFLILLERHHCHERSVQFYAKQLHITPKYLSTVTHKYIGMPASEAIDRYALLAIKHTLFAHTQTVKDISAVYHFPSHSFFGRFFKRLTGITPNTYVAQMHQ